MDGVTPSFATGFARHRGEAKYPDLWDGLTCILAPCLGVQGSQVFDFSGRHNSGILKGGASWLGNSVYCNGTGEGIELAGVQAFNAARGTLIMSYERVGSPLIFSALFNADNVTNDSPSEPSFQMDGGDQVRHYPNADESNNVYWEFGISWNTVFPANVKKHIVLTWDQPASSLLGYLDGVLTGRKNGAGWTLNTLTDGEKVGFGGRPTSHPGDDYSCRGKLHYVYLYERVLAASERLFLWLHPLAVLQLADTPITRAAAAPPPAPGRWWFNLSDRPDKELLLVG